jgi:hypothetical protein
MNWNNTDAMRQATLIRWTIYSIVSAAYQFIDWCFSAALDNEKLQAATSQALARGDMRLDKTFVCLLGIIQK